MFHRERLRACVREPITKKGETTMKKILTAILCFVSLVFTQNICFVKGKNLVKCVPEKSNGETFASFYWMQKDGSWVLKSFENNGDDAKLVHVFKLGKVKSWPCVVDPITRKRFLRPSELGPECESTGDFFINGVRNGSNIEIPFFEELFDEIIVHGGMTCGSTKYRGDYVKTVRINQVTGLVTDFKEYQNLKHGTYCEDFVATDGLYWKP